MTEKKMLEQVEDMFEDASRTMVGDLMGHLHTLARASAPDLETADEIRLGLENHIKTLTVILKQAEKVTEVHRRLHAVKTAQTALQSSLKTIAETEFGLDLE